MSNTLLSTHYDLIRLLTAVHIQLRLYAFLDRTAQGSQNGGLRSLKIGFSCIWFPPLIEGGVLGSSTTWNSYPPRANGGQDVAFPF